MQRSANSFLAVCIVIATALVGCRYPATEVMVAVDSDAPTDRLLTVTVAVRAGGSMSGGSSAATFSRGPMGSTTFPASFAIVPPANGPRDGNITLQLEATLAASATAPEHRFRRTARFRFTNQRTTHVPLFLSVSCGNPTTGCTSVDDAHCTVSTRCEDQGQTCGDNGTCIAPDIMPIESDAAIVVPTSDATLTMDVETDATDTTDTPQDTGPAPDPAVDICASNLFTCIARSSGAVACTGFGGPVPAPSGLLLVNRMTPVPGITDAVAVTCGRGHACARGRSGSVYCWGNNESGQLGDGTVMGPRGARAVGGITDAAAVAAGDAFTCVQRTGGAVACWGANESGQLGDGTTMSHAMPAPVTGLRTATSIAAGSGHVCVTLMDTSVMCWGRNNTSQLGDGTAVNQPTPVAVPTLTGVSELSAGTGHTCARTGNTVSCWGNNSSGQLCSGDNTAPITAPTVAMQLTGIAGIAAQRAQHTCALRTNGTVACCGLNTFSALGDSASDINTLPVDVTGVVNASKIVVSETHGCALSATGSVECWGDDEAGQLGDGFEGFRSASPARVAITGTATHISAGLEHTCAVVTGGRSQCWGANTFGQLGDGSTRDRAAPADVTGVSSFPNTVTGATHSCTHNVDIAECWGDNAYGQFGDGTRVSRPTAGPGPTFAGALAELAAGSFFTCARRGDGAVLCWGSNNFGQLGNGMPGVDAQTPQLIMGLTASDIAVGEQSVCARNATNDVVCWGRNSSGELGDGTHTNRATPVSVMGVTGAAEVTAGRFHACARLAGSGVICWGANTSGQLGSTAATGDGTPVPGTSNVTAMSAGGSFTCVRRDTGHVSCWGENAYGDLGRGAVGPPDSMPQDVIGLSNVSEVECGGAHCCALEMDGSVWCWGANTRGQLGNSVLPVQAHPVAMRDVP